MPLLSRRRFLNHSCLLLGACSSATMASTAVKTSSPLKAQPSLKQFKYAQVQLGDSGLRDQFKYQSHLFMGIDDDKLLKPFRSRAGQDAPGEDMGGWYDDSKDFHIDPNDIVVIFQNPETITNSVKAFIYFLRKILEGTIGRVKTDGT